MKYVMRKWEIEHELKQNGKCTGLLYLFLCLYMGLIILNLKSYFKKGFYEVDNSLAF